MSELEIVAGIYLLVIASAFFGAFAVQDLEWRLARRRRRRARGGEVDLRGWRR